MTPTPHTRPPSTPAVSARASGGRDWRWTAAAVLVVLAVAGLGVPAPVVGLAEAQQAADEALDDVDDDGNDAVDDLDDGNDGGAGADPPEQVDEQTDEIGDCEGDDAVLHHGHRTRLPDSTPMDHIKDVAVADLTGNGHGDILATDFADDDQLVVWLANPDVYMGFEQTSYQIADGESRLEVANLTPHDNDHLDVALTNEDGNGTHDRDVQVFLNDGAGGLAQAPDSPHALPVVDQQQRPANARDLTVTDITGNGVADLVVASSNTEQDNKPATREVVVLRGRGDGTFADPGAADRTDLGQYETEPQKPQRIVAADLFDNGRVDIATANHTSPSEPSTVSVLATTAEGTLSYDAEYAAINSDSRADQAMVADDLNGDGHVDLAVKEGGVLFGQGDGQFADVDEQNGALDDGWGLGTADMTGNGVAELVTAGVNKRNVAVWAHTADGLREAATCDIFGAGALTVGDAVGNGEPTDVVIGQGPKSENAGVVVLHPRPAELAGRVVAESGQTNGTGDEVAGEPIEGAEVTVTRVDDGPGSRWSLSDRTGSAGRYGHHGPSGEGVGGQADEVTGGEEVAPDGEPDAAGDRLEVAPGASYRVRVEHEAYVPEEKQVAEEALAAGETVLTDFVLEPRLGAVEGEVTAAGSGEPLAGVEVVVEADGESVAVADDGPAGRDDTDGDGWYVVAGLEAGDYDVTADAEAYQAATKSVAVPDEPDARRRVDFALEPEPGVIDGQVVDGESGEAIADAQVTVGDGETVAGEATSGGQGAFEVAGLAPDEYRVTADADDYRPDSREGVMVAAGGRATVELVLSPRGEDDAGDGPDESGDDGGGGDEADGSATQPADSGGEPAGGDAGGEPAGDPAGEPGGESAGDPAGEPGGESAGDPAGESAGDPAGEPSGESAGDPAGEAGGEASGEPAGDPAGEVAGDPAAEAGGQASGEPAAAPVAGEAPPAAAEASAPAPADAPAPASGGPPEAAAAPNPPQAGAAQGHNRQVAPPPVETEGVPAGEDAWLATDLSQGSPATLVTGWLAAAMMTVGVAGWAGGRCGGDRRRGSAGPVWARGRWADDQPDGPGGPGEASPWWGLVAGGHEPTAGVVDDRSDTTPVGSR